MSELIPVHKATNPATGLHVVFVHGLNPSGNQDHHLHTWMSNPNDEGTFWPTWLVDQAGVGAWLFRYDANASSWTGDAMSSAQQGVALLDTLASCQALNGKPLLLIGHSMGGLVIKHALVHTVDSKDARLIAVTSCVKGVVFLATPHKGSKWAGRAKLLINLFGSSPTAALGGLLRSSDDLQDLNSAYLQRRIKLDLDGLVYAETQPTAFGPKWLNRKIIVVDPNSSDPKINGFDAVGIAADHNGVAQPKSKMLPPYTGVVALVNKLKTTAANGNDGASFGHPTTGATTDVPTPEPLATQPVWPLPAPEIALTDSHRTALHRTLAVSVTSTPSFIAHRYAQLRLQPLGGDESGDHATFVNLRLQPVANANAADQKTPESFDSLAKMLAEYSGANEPIWQLRGEPGAGKSTLLMDLELRCAHAALEAWHGDPNARPEVCVFISLAGWDATAATPDVQAMVQQRWEDQCNTVSSSGGTPLDLKDLAKQTRLRFLFDGLNEITVNNSAQRTAALKQLCIWASRRVRAGQPAPVFSVRKLNYLAFPSGHGLQTTRVADVEAWGAEQVEQYCERRFPNQGNPLWQAIKGHDKRTELTALFGNPFNLALQCQLFDPARAAATLAANRGDLMGRIALRRLNQLLARGHDDALSAPGLFDFGVDPRRIADAVANLDAGALHQAVLRGDWLPRMRQIALALHTANKGGWAEWGDTANVNGMAPADWMPALLAAASLNIATEVGGKHRFSHQLWQEYFAASALACDNAATAGTPVWQGLDLAASMHVEVPDGVWELPSPEPTFWDQCVQLAAQIADAKQANALLAHLLNVNLALAGRAALGRQQDVEPSLLTKIKMALLKRSTDAAIELPLRIEAGLLLGKLGDDIRFVEGVGPEGHHYLLPRAMQPGGTLGFVPVPGGQHQVGGLKEYKDSANVVPVEIAPGLELAFAPVTRAEFQCFVDADGYGGIDDPAPSVWWQGQLAVDWWNGKLPKAGLKQAWLDMRKEWHDASRGPQWVADKRLTNWLPEEIEAQIAPKMALDDGGFMAFVEAETAASKEREPALWDDSRFNNPAQPVVGVSLFEAQAYCRWLSHQCGKTVRLPSEAEWEVAARGGGQRGVHWPGDGPEGPNVNTANSLDTKVRSTAPTGAFPNGHADGLVDVCGQVWEWTTSAWTADKIHKDQVNDTLAGDDLAERAVRGGSWGSPSQSCRAAFRFGIHPDSRYYFLGLRLLVCPIQTPES
jgi:formylglycine-generating enzyme required for sulfatase activity/pimeloyl-ACP methyl ester carboxylesterase